jgi:hypothetical protein
MPVSDDCFDYTQCSMYTIEKLYYFEREGVSADEKEIA